MRRDCNVQREGYPEHNGQIHRSIDSSTPSLMCGCLRRCRRNRAGEGGCRCGGGGPAAHHAPDAQQRGR